ncbi:ubiquitin carboxyl-terminal hydrolase [Diplocarpon rosae]|nr:ubiquitin carboxyl-terminal hydrolase [Diplocarpon rosae]
MEPSDPRLRDQFGAVPDYFDNGYHQDFHQGIVQPSSAAGSIFLVICLVPVVYQILLNFGYNLLPLPELLWNILVYVTPSQLLDAVETYQNPLRITNISLQDIPRTHAAKSEAMRRIIGLDRPGGIIESVAQAGRRRLSTLPGLNLGAQGDGRPAGLGNWDNSCYQNSVLQGLASLDSLSGFLANSTMEESLDDVAKLEMKMTGALRELIATLKDPSNNGKRIWTPATLKNMSSWQQQDAQEYFSKVLDEIDKEVGKMAELARSPPGFEQKVSSGRSSPGPESLALFRNPLEGLIAQRVGCTICGYSEGLSMIPFNCLTVPLTRSWECDLSECLDEYTKLEQIKGVECSKCTLLKYQRLLTNLVEKQKSAEAEESSYKAALERLTRVEEALEMDDYEEKTLLQKCSIPSKNRVSSTKSRQAVVARPPKSLVVHFNRSIFDEMTGELKKNLSHVRFPRILDLGPWCLGSSGTTDDPLTEAWLLNPEKPMIASTIRPSRLTGPNYELRAVVTHYGRHENGHYVCYKKFPVPGSDDVEVIDELGRKEQWWRLSDDDVTKVSEDNVLGQGGVFMLFYDCIAPGTTKNPVPEVLDATNATTEIQAPEISLGFVEPDPNRKKPMLSDLTVAVGLPLPNIHDDEIPQSDDQESLIMPRECITTVSECDEDEVSEQRHPVGYQPAKAILVTPYANKAGHSPNPGKENQRIMSPGGSLVMV